MKKFFGTPYDVTDFVTEGKIDYLAGLTDELEKTAHVPSRDEVEEMPNSDFALVLYHPHLGFMKKYATNEKYATKLNIKLLLDNQRKYPDEIVKTAAHYLARAARNYRLSVPDELQKLAEGTHITNIVDLDGLDETAWHLKQKQFTKTAVAPEYALPEKHKYPIQTAELVKKAMAYFEKNATRFTPLDALNFVAHVKKAAIKHNIPIENSLIAKYASLTSRSFNSDMKHLLQIRKSYVLEKDAAVYDELYQKSKELGVIKTAECLEQVDRRLGINKLWNTKLENPFLSVLGHTKEANCSMHKGKKVYRHQLKKAAESIVDPATLTDLNGEDGLAVFESLPTPIKDKITERIK